MTLVSENIRYLRKLNGMTQEQFSRKINIKRSLLGAYEEGRANPNTQNMTAIARAFNTTVELLTRQDLRKVRETPSLNIPLGGEKAPDEPKSIREMVAPKTPEKPFQHPDFPDIFDDDDTEPEPIAAPKNQPSFYQPPAVRPVPPPITAPVTPAAEPVRTPTQPPAAYVQPTETPTFGAPVTLPVVWQTRFADYAQRYQQPDFLSQLTAMTLPTLAAGLYRAFEAGPEYTFPGALLIGQHIRNWYEIADGKLYVLLLAGQGLCYRRVYNQVKFKGTLLLVADYADIPNQEILLKDVLEVWQIQALVSRQMPAPAPNPDRLRQLVEELRFEVERMQG